MRYAIISIEPRGNRVACLYVEADQAQALQELTAMGSGVTVLRPDDCDNFDDLPTWEYHPGVGWVG